MSDSWSLFVNGSGSRIAGPSSTTSWSNPITFGIGFEATAATCYFAGFWWWVCPSGQSTTVQTFALWQEISSNSGIIVPATTVTSGALTANAWNYIPLTTPIPLTQGVAYRAVTGFTGNFPDTQNQFGSGDLYAAGITGRDVAGNTGSLFAYSDFSGSAPDIFSSPQFSYATAGSDPTNATDYPGGGSNQFNGWLDVQLTNAVPTGATYRIWPNMPSTLQGLSSDTTGYILATEFSMSQAAALDKIWFYSPSGAAALPTRCAVWSVSTQAEVTGTDNSSPTWKDPSGTTANPGDGWVYCDYSSAGVTLSGSTNYKVSAYHAAGSEWMSATSGYWTTGGLGASGRSNGILSAPNNAGAAPGQSSYVTTWSYPASTVNSENYWVDIEVTPATVSLANNLLLASGIV